MNKKVLSRKSSTCKQIKMRKRILFLTGFLLLLIFTGIHICHLYLEIPFQVIEFGEKYPEAKNYVLGYPFCKNLSPTGNIQLNLQEDGYPLFIQWDKKWEYQYYGDNLMGINGCGPTSLSMVVCGLTGNAIWNPWQVALFADSMGYYVPNVGTSWELMTEGARALGLSSENGYVSAEYIQSHLSPTSPMICSMYPGDFTYTGHFIVLTGIDSNGDIIVHDPNSRKNSLRHWPIDILLPQICKLWTFTLSDD